MTQTAGTQTAKSIASQYAGEYVVSNPAILGRRVRCLEGVRAGETGTVIKVNKRSIRVAIDPKPGMDFTETMIGSQIYFEAIA